MPSFSFSCLLAFFNAFERVSCSARFRFSDEWWFLLCFWTRKNRFCRADHLRDTNELIAPYFFWTLMSTMLYLLVFALSNSTVILVRATNENYHRWSNVAFLVEVDKKSVHTPIASVYIEEDMFSSRHLQRINVVCCFQKHDETESNRIVFSLVGTQILEATRTNWKNVKPGISLLLIPREDMTILYRSKTSYASQLRCFICQLQCGIFKYIYTSISSRHS